MPCACGSVRLRVAPAPTSAAQLNSGEALCAGVGGGGQREILGGLVQSRTGFFGHSLKGGLT